MKRLLLLRHAKSARPPGIADHERPLAPRGTADARKLGAYLRQELLIPDLALVSTAMRTRQTWDLVARALGEAPSVRFEKAIYDADCGARLDALVCRVPAGVKMLLMIGHNPGFEEFALWLAGHGDRYALARMREKFPTCALAVLDVHAQDWTAFKAGAARLDRFVTPKSLGHDEDS
jgi:phosphohistidine phosphatase